MTDPASSDNHIPTNWVSLSPDDVYTYGQTLTLRCPRHYLVDWSKVKTIEDMAAILSAAFPFSVSEDSAQFSILKKYLKEEPTS